MILIYRKGIKDDLTPNENAVLRKLNGNWPAMNKRLFERLVESVRQHGKIARVSRGRCYGEGDSRYDPSQSA